MPQQRVKADLDALYAQYWKPFDDRAGYWRKAIKQGRFFRPQIDLFLQHYLTLVTRGQVSACPSLFGVQGVRRTQATAHRRGPPQ